MIQRRFTVLIFIIIASCGRNSPENNKKTSDNGCHTANTYDSHVLAVTWQTGFCLTHKNKKECENLAQNSFALNNFTLHGLWPNKNSCDIYYNYCSDIPEEKGDFCTLPDYTLDPAIADKLKQVMPSAQAKTCLDRHEWWKHGVCRDKSATDYFKLSLELLEQINKSNFVTEFLRSSTGKKVTRSQLYLAFRKAFGPSSDSKIGIYCTKEMLTEIQINLPRVLDKSFKDLIAASSIQPKKGTCPDSFLIPNISTKP